MNTSDILQNIPGATSELATASERRLLHLRNARLALDGVALTSAGVVDLLTECPALEVSHFSDILRYVACENRMDKRIVNLVC